MTLTKVQTFLALLPAFIFSFVYAGGLRKVLQHLLNLSGTHALTFLCGLVLPRIVIGLISRVKISSKDKTTSGSSIYGLDHGRLHLEIPPPMWMNMGYWHQEKDHYDLDDQVRNAQPMTLAIACKDLLNEVLKTAGFDRKIDSLEGLKGVRQSKCLIDLGFGCGEQSIYLVSEASVRRSDRQWWDNRPSSVRWDYYVGATLDRKQFQFAEERVQEFERRSPRRDHTYDIPHVKLCCANAANPKAWSDELKVNVATALANTHDHWVLALDTLYHFPPSRWPVIKHFARLNTSFMAFDLCLSSQASLSERIILRILTTIMGAPWANFVTADQYRRKLIEAGYLDENITIKDISPHVFEPLAAFLEAQDRRLKVVGYGLGLFRVAQWMFAWWGRSGVVRGIIVVAKR